MLGRGICLPIVVAVIAIMLGNGTAAGATTAAGHVHPTVTAADVCNYSTSRPTLKIGDTGPAVKQLQCYLNHSLDPARYPPLPISGVFDQFTAARLLVFQTCTGIPADGIVGPVTWAELRTVANSGSYLSC